MKAGKVRYIGCSNFSAAQLEEAQSAARQNGLTSFVCCQDEYSLLVRGLEKDRIAVMQKYGLGLLPFFPLASGMLTGKYKRGAAPPAGTRLATTKRLADSVITARNWRHCRCARRVREAARPHAA